MDILRVLEQRAWDIKPEEIEEIGRKENWAFWNDANPAALTDSLGISDGDFFRLTNNAHRVKTIVEMLQMLLNTALEIQQELEEPIRLKPKPIIKAQSKGITSLPEEILRKTFALSVLPGERKQAIRLSHISRYFRAVAFAEPELWTTIHSRARPELLNAFLARCGDNTDLHVVIFAGDRSFIPIPDFLGKCCPLAHRWKSLTIFGKSFATMSVNHILKFIDENIRQHLDRLEALHVKDEDSRNLMYGLNPALDPANPNRYTPRWNSPRLRDLHFLGYLPKPVSPFTSVTSLTFSIMLHPFGYHPVTAEFFSFLSGTPSVTDLTLAVPEFSLSQTSALEEFQFTVIQCPSITSLNLRLMDVTVGKRETRLLYVLTRTLSIPCLKRLSISIEFAYRELIKPYLDGNTGTQLLRDLSDALLPSPYARSQLTSLTYEFSLSLLPIEKTYISLLDVNLPPRIFTIPLDRVPALLSLTITTCIQPRFYRSRFSAPHEIRMLRLCERSDIAHHMDGESLREVVKSLRDAGVWENMERVVLGNCTSLPYETALDIVGKDKLHFMAS